MDSLPLVTPQKPWRHSYKGIFKSGGAWVRSDSSWGHSEPRDATVRKERQGNEMKLFHQACG